MRERRGEERGGRGGDGEGEAMGGLIGWTGMVFWYSGILVSEI